MSTLVDLVPALQRALAVPGTYETLFPETSEDDLLATLLDALAEAQLDGMLTEHTATDLGIVDPELTRAQSALVVMYASVRILSAEFRNRKTHVRYEGGGAVFEEDQSAQMLRELLLAMNQRKLDLIKAARTSGSATAFCMADAYLERVGAPDWR